MTTLVAGTAAASALAAVVAFRARCILPDKHSNLYAYLTFGPITTFLAVRRVNREIFDRLMVALGSTGRTPEKDYILKYKPQPSDVVVAVPAKSGTTWIMHIAHQLRMKGEEIEFEDQLDIMAWLEGGAARVLKQDINMPQPAEPRVFKSHLPLKRLSKPPFPPNLKIIYCFRDEKDRCYSSWRFLLPFFELTQDDISCNEFCIRSIQVGLVDAQLNSLCDFWEHRHDDRVCFFFFEDLKERHRECVQRIQRFMGLGEDEALTQTVVEQTTHKYMSRPDLAHRFDGHKTVHAIDKFFGRIRTMPVTGKVRKDGGKTGEGSKVPRAVADWIDWRWRCIVLPRTGFADLSSMRAQWAQELGVC